MDHVEKFTWRIENFSAIKDKKLYSETFIVVGNKWRVCIYPKGNKVDHLSIYLYVVDSANLPSGWSRHAQFGFAIIDQKDRKSSCTKVAVREFGANATCRGFPSFLALSELHNPERSYLVDDACLVEAYVSTDGTKGLTSRKLLVEIASGSLANEPEEATESVMNLFFTSLESKLLAKKEIAKLVEAFNETPVDLYDSEKISPLNQALKNLASSDCSSTMLTIEDKNALLAIGERLIELANRATKAQQDKHCFAEKNLTKSKITRNLDRQLIRYKKIDSEVKEFQEKIVALLAEQKGIFKSSTKMKSELETLEKECVEYETKTKIADEEVKIDEAEWRKMTDFISSIREKI